jgi:hypothetical protein
MRQNASHPAYRATDIKASLRQAAGKRATPDLFVWTVAAKVHFKKQ